MSDVPAIGHTLLNEIRSEFNAYVSASAAIATRQERRREAILHGDTPTFMEVDVARTAEQLKGADAVVLGFPFEGPTSISPSRSAPPTIGRPPAGSVYWRMGADVSPDHIRKYSIFYSKEHNGGYHPEIDSELVLHEALKVVDFGNCTYHADDTMSSIREGIERVGQIVDVGAIPFVLGGDHTTPYPVLKAILSRRSAPVGLVVFDGHVDFSVTRRVLGIEPVDPIDVGNREACTIEHHDHRHPFQSQRHRRASACGTIGSEGLHKR